MPTATTYNQMTPTIDSDRNAQEIGWRNN